MTTTSYHSTQPIIADSELPAQTSATNGQALISNGMTSSWQFITAMIGTNAGQVSPNGVTNAILPDQSGNVNCVLWTDGANTYWDFPDANMNTSGPTIPQVFELAMEDVTLLPIDYPSGSILVLSADAMTERPPTVWLDESFDYPIGSTIILMQESYATVSIESGSFNLFHKGDGYQLDGRNCKATLTKINANSWLLDGDVIIPPV